MSIDGMADRVMRKGRWSEKIAYTSTVELRGTIRVYRHKGFWQLTIIRQGGRFYLGITDGFLPRTVPKAMPSIGGPGKKTLADDNMGGRKSINPAATSQQGLNRNPFFNRF